MEQQKMTWEEMKKRYPNEWLLVIDYECDKSGHLVAGVVLRHSKSKDEVYALPGPKQGVAFRYTGKSTFAGLRSHATHDHTF